MDQDLTTDPDGRLMARIGAGDHAAMSELVSRHKSGLFNFFHRYTNDSALAEDLTQETMLRVLKSAPTYQPLAPFGVWLYRIAKNLCLNELDSRKVRSRRVDGEVRSRRTPEDDVGQAEREARVLRAVRQLPVRQRLALVLCRFEGLQIAEIAQVMETSETAVEGLLSRAADALRASLDDLLDRRHPGRRAPQRKR